MSLYIDLGLYDALLIGNDTYVTLERKSGSRARLCIVGSSEVQLMRKAKLLENYGTVPIFSKAASQPDASAMAAVASQLAASAMAAVNSGIKD